MTGVHPKIRDVVRLDLCTGCGACIPVCPNDNLSKGYSEYRGAPEPVVGDEKQCIDCEAPCDSVCPSISTRHEFDGRSSRLGHIEGIWLGYSEEYRNDGTSSSGGIVRAIVVEALRSGEAVVCLGTADLRGGFDAELFSDLRQLSNLPGSIYHSVGFFSAIPLLRRVESKVVVVAIPCHLTGLMNFIDQYEPEIASKISLKLGIICGWMYTNHSIQNFLLILNQ